jgi:hypothetical protein
VAYQYHARVLEELARHGLVPQPDTPPDRLRDAVRDLYKYEIRRLRQEVLAGRIRKPDYAGRVIALRARYPLLSLPVRLWLQVPGGGRQADPGRPPDDNGSSQDHEDHQDHEGK